MIERQPAALSFFIMVMKGIYEMEKLESRALDELFEAMLTLRNKDECRRFFEDICTIKELQDISQRLWVASMLKEKKVYAEIATLTGASTATISRVNRCLSYGSGGYDIVLGRLNSAEIKKKK